MREKERERVFFPRWTLRVCSSMENYSRDRLSEILRMNSLTFAQSFLIDFTKSNFFLLSYPERSKTHGRLNTKRFNRPRSTTIRFLRTDNVANVPRALPFSRIYTPASTMFSVHLVSALSDKERSFI